MWICPKCERELKNASQRHYCAKVSIDSLFEGKPAELAFVFDKLLCEIVDWEDVAVSATPKLHRICSQPNFPGNTTYEKTVGYKILFCHATRR